MNASDPTLLSFDLAVMAVGRVLAEAFGPEALADGRVAVLRNALGELTAVFRDEGLERELVLEQLRAFSPYVNWELPIATPRELFDDTLYSRDLGYWTDLGPEAGNLCIRLIDRRIVGNDWLRKPQENPTNTPIVVFASLKGGVGRSTALAVAATHYARQGLNVLAVDLDLEAPGIGSILLSEDERPLFGSIDYFVETKFGMPAAGLAAAIIGSSELASGRGILSVVPAVGKISKRYPQNVLAKLARAYLDLVEGSEEKSFTDQVRGMLEMLARASKYDLILVDVRAGLHESTAASILGLGALVLLFGVDTPQTFEGYRYLLAGLKGSSDGQGDWRSNLRFVHAKASTDDGLQRKFRDQCFDVMADYFYELAEAGEQDAFNFDLDDEAAPHFAWPIFNSSQFAEFDPLAQPEQLNDRVYMATFGDFIAGLSSSLEIAEARNE